MFVTRERIYAHPVFYSSEKLKKNLGAISKF
jgi:hypothetical protein